MKSTFQNAPSLSGISGIFVVHFTLGITETSFMASQECPYWRSDNQREPHQARGAIMIVLIFLVFLSLYLFVGINIDQWITISLLGFKLQTPEFFMTNPRTYDVVRGLILAATAACLFGVTFAWYFGV